MVTGPGEDTELLRRREVLIPEKLKFLTRKSNLQKPIWKLEYMKESKGMWQPEQIDRKEMKYRRIARCLGQKDWKRWIGNKTLLKPEADENQTAKFDK